MYPLMVTWYAYPLYVNAYSPVHEENSVAENGRGMSLPINLFILWADLKINKINTIEKQSFL